MQNKLFLFFSILTGLFYFSCNFVKTNQIQNERIKYELPEILDSSAIVSHYAYTLNYKEKYEQAEWVAYLLTKDMITGEEERENNFRIDSSVVTGSANPDDYKYSGYDKGHLAPAADMSWSKEAMSESFFMSNMSPQKSGFNRGIWKKLEEKVREFAKENDSIYITTGPILKDGLKTIGENHIMVPNYYYKVIVVYKRTDLDHEQGINKGIGFVLENRSTNEKLERFSVTIDSVETLTGINFFAKIPRKIQERIENECDVEEWIKGKVK